MSAKYKSAVIQGIRFFVVAFVAVYPASNLIGYASGSQPLDLAALRAAAVAGMVAVGGFIWRAWVPQSPLTDKNPAA
jgi:hypothetical protein